MLGGMTNPAPPPLNEPLTTLQELAVWVQEPEIPEDKIAFATNILMGVAVVIRMAGSIYWTHDDVHPRAKLLADIKAKNFYEHPTGATSETVGPLSERYLDEVVEQFKLSDAEALLLASLVTPGEEPDGDGTLDTGLWTLSTTRGPLETHQHRTGYLTVPFVRGQSSPYYAIGAFGSPEE